MQLQRNKSFSWLVVSEYQNHNIMLAFQTPYVRNAAKTLWERGNPVNVCYKPPVVLHMKSKKDGWN